MNCDPEKIQKVDIFKLRCGRYVSAAQIDNVFANKLYRTTQPDYVGARAILEPLLPAKERNDHSYTI